MSRWLRRYGLILFLFPATLAAQDIPHRSSPVPSASRHEDVSGARMLTDVTALSAPDYNGRQTGTADDLASGVFVAERFASLGLKDPTSDPGRPWMMIDRVTATAIGPDPRLEFFLDTRPLLARPGTDYLPILDSPSVNVTAPVIFVGYGISDPARRFDEYDGIDVRNRIVLFIRGKPESYGAPVTQADKERVAREKGAVAYLTMTGPILSAYELRKGLDGKPLALYSQSNGERPLPGAWISSEFAQALFPSQLMKNERSMREIQDQLNHLAPQSMATTVLVSLKWNSAQTTGALHNVLALLPGSDPARADDTIILGAHRDHFGRQAGLLFPGGDDNASGTAVLLEVARALAQSSRPPARSILFVSFSGEEQGLLGSKFYASRPVRPLETTVAMINIDHAGIGNGRLTVGVTGLPKPFAMEAGRRAGLSEKLDVFGFFPGGDHVPFVEARVPTITVVSGGIHPNFHQPSDTADTVRPDILEEVASYVVALIRQLADKP
ncbi:MAG TPA: M28 family peptidase [Nitrospiraceae bacterium]|nr:M28 family peptidase [Nitrospiraceae bacterium]